MALQGLQGAGVGEWRGVWGVVEVDQVASRHGARVRVRRGAREMLFLSLARSRARARALSLLFHMRM